MTLVPALQIRGRALPACHVQSQHVDVIVEVPVEVHTPDLDMTQSRNSVRHVHSSLRCRDFLHDGERTKRRCRSTFPCRLTPKTKQRYLLSFWSPTPALSRAQWPERGTSGGYWASAPVPCWAASSPIGRRNPRATFSTNSASSRDGDATECIAAFRMTITR